MSLSSFLYVTPPCNNRSLHTKSRHPQHRDLKNQAESQHCDDRLTLSEQVVARWQSLVAFICARYHTAALPRPSKWPAKGGGHVAHRCVELCWLCSRRPPGQSGASSRPMAEFSGFYESPGPTSSGDALHCTGALPWLSKWPAAEVHLFAATAYFDCCNRS